MSKTSIDRSAPSSDLVRLTMSGPAMGSRWSATLFAPAALDGNAVAQAIGDAVEAVEAQMSSWRSTSDLERLNRMPIGVWMPIPAMLFEVLETALAIGRLSDGSFDVGVGDLVRVHGFGGGSRLPDRDGIEAIAGRASFEPPKTLELDHVNRRARRLAPLTLDLSGIAKGYGVDRMAAVVAGFGVASFLVGLDGEMRSGARKPDGRPWVVGQEKPDGAVRSLQGVLELTEAAVATSGDYRRVHDIDGRRVSHTIDPRTGRPLVGDLAQVTVVAATCTTADAWATALMVAGADKGLALARKLGLAAILVGTDGSTLSTL